jgi:hypothetical protein
MTARLTYCSASAQATGRLSARVEGGGETEWLEAINRPALIALLGSAAFLSVRWPRPLTRHYVALRSFHIGAASIYVVKFSAEPMQGGKPG